MNAIFVMFKEWFILNMIDADKLLSECPCCEEYYAVLQQAFIQEDFESEYIIPDYCIHSLFQCKCGASWAVIWEIPL